MKVIITIVSALLIIALCFAWYIGSFINMNVKEKPEGGFKVVGRGFTGSYSKAGGYIKEVDEKLKSLGFSSSKGFGIYYDDPKTTPPKKCRSFVGNIIEKKDFDKIPELKGTGLKIDSIPLSSTIVTEFPIKTSLSYMIGPMKAYPEILKYISEKKYSATLTFEVYDTQKEKILFAMQYEK